MYGQLCLNTILVHLGGLDLVDRWLCASHSREQSRAWRCAQVQSGELGDSGVTTTKDDKKDFMADDFPVSNDMSASWVLIGPRILAGFSFYEDKLLFTCASHFFRSLIYCIRLCAQ